jgi:hypothetical protein
MTYTISWPVPAHGTHGGSLYLMAGEETLPAAESCARRLSRQHGHATVSDRVSHVATFIGGERRATPHADAYRAGLT